MVLHKRRRVSDAGILFFPRFLLQCTDWFGTFHSINPLYLMDSLFLLGSYRTYMILHNMTDLYTPVFLYMMCKNLWKLHASILNCFRVLCCLHPRFSKPVGKINAKRQDRFECVELGLKTILGGRSRGVWFHKAVFEQILLWNPKNHTLIPATF